MPTRIYRKISLGLSRTGDSSWSPVCSIPVAFRSLALTHFQVFEHSTPPPPANAETQSAIRKRDGNMCCITGKAGRLWDPLIVVPILQLPSRWLHCEVSLTPRLLKIGHGGTKLNLQPQIHEMLGAFFTPPYRDWWLAYTRDPEIMDPLCCHWLVRKSAAHAFKRALVRFDRLQPSMLEVSQCYFPSNEIARYLPSILISY